MSKDLYVKNIALEVGEEELRKLFAVCGRVAYIHLVKDSRTGEFIGRAYVKMASEAEAKDARVTLDGARLGNREIVVVEALPQRPAGSPAKGERRPAKAVGREPAAVVTRGGKRHETAGGKPGTGAARGKGPGKGGGRRGK